MIAGVSVALNKLTGSLSSVGSEIEIGSDGSSVD